MEINKARYVSIEKAVDSARKAILDAFFPGEDREEFLFSVDDKNILDLKLDSLVFANGDKVTIKRGEEVRIEDFILDEQDGERYFADGTKISLAGYCGAGERFPIHQSESRDVYANILYGAISMTKKFTPIDIGKDVIPRLEMALGNYKDLGIERT